MSYQRTSMDRMLDWMRYRSWTVVVGVLLVFLGITNIYPFLWMVGTSLKSDQEAASNRADPWPDVKFHITTTGAAWLPEDLNQRQLKLLKDTQTRELRRSEQDRAARPVRIWVDSYSAASKAPPAEAEAELEALVQRGALAIAPPLRSFRLTDPDAAPDAGGDLLPRQRDLLASLREKHRLTGATPRVDAQDYAREHNLAYTEAGDELAAIPGLKADPPVRAYMLKDATDDNLHDGVSARQLWLMRSLHDDDERRRKAEAQETFIELRMTPRQYADAVGLYVETKETVPDLRKASAQLAGIRAHLEEHDPATAPAPDSFTEEQTLVWQALDDPSDPLRKLFEANDSSAYARHFDLRMEIVQRTHDLDAAENEMAALVSRGFLATDQYLWRNYIKVLADMKFWVNILTTLLLATGVVVLVVLVSSMLGYALARLRFPGKMVVLMLLLAGMVAPQEAIIIPIFRMLQPTGAFEGLWGMVLWMSAGVIGNSLLMAGFFLSLPKEVEEAATVDGAGPFRTFFDVALPMARPIVMTVGLFAFIGAWNNFLVAFVTTQAKPTMQPLAVAVYSFQQGHTGMWGLTNAAAAIMIVPVIILFLLLQRFIVKAIAVGAVKG